jgi:2,3-bisphosphoglycerate-independent phosphoglycerate mutase
MKTIIILGDGMADYPIPELDGKTPLMVAKKPVIDDIARNGRTGLFQTIDPDMPTGSAVANLSVLGYNPRETFQGRGVLEAASLGVALSPTDLAMRVNLINIDDGKIYSHSSGHISNEEAHVLIKDLNNHFNNLNIILVPGLSYRHVLVIPDGNSNIECAPPHDHLGELVDDLLIRPLSPEAEQTAELLNRLIRESQDILRKHPVNKDRIAKGQQPANSLWPWSPGKKPKMDLFEDRFSVKGAVITAVDLIKGLAIYAGLTVIPVKGATGLYDTNYEGKANACLNALDDHDFVYVHVEAPDEAGHDKNLDLKIRCIENLDKRLTGHIIHGMEKKKSEFVIAVLPDHPTPIQHGAHTRDPVPVAIMDPRKKPDSVTQYDEKSVISGSLGLLKGSEFIESLLSK